MSPVLTRREAATFLGMSLSKFERLFQDELVRLGLLCKLGGEYVTTEENLRTWLDTKGLRTTYVPSVDVQSSSSAPPKVSKSIVSASRTTLSDRVRRNAERLNRRRNASGEN